MASLNKVMILGNLGKDPDLRYTQSGQAVANFSIATSDRWTDKASGQAQERTEWHRIVVWGKQAENCGKYLRKGASALIEGRLQTREYADPKDNTQKRYIAEVIADHITFVGGNGGGKSGGGMDAHDTAPRATTTQSVDDDIPF